MSGTTKQAIRDSFLKLLNERPIAHITVKDIVEDCGVNRNSFYYHYQNLPALVEEIILEEADKIIQAHPTVDSLGESLELAISFVLENRRAALHLYNSANRALFEQYLWKVCGHVIDTYISTAFADSPMRDSDKHIIIRSYMWSWFGGIIDWLNSGLTDDIQAMFYRLEQLKKGTLEKMVERSLLTDEN